MWDRFWFPIDWESYLKAFHFSAEEEKLIAEKVFKSQIWNERDRGLFPEEEYRKRFIAELPAEYEADVKRVIEESGKTIGIKDYAETWTSYLKSQGYHLYILSNYSQFMLDQTRPGKMPFLKNMDGVIFSCEVQQIKPEADIYETLLSRFGLKRRRAFSWMTARRTARLQESLVFMPLNSMI